jgi:hypothetical protein
MGRKSSDRKSSDVKLSESKIKPPYEKEDGIIYLHEEIMTRMIQRDLLPNEYVIHINNDILDNRRGNLRLITIG